MKQWFVEYWPDGASCTSIWPKTNEPSIEAETAEDALDIFNASPNAPKGRVVKAWETRPVETA